MGRFSSPDPSGLYYSDPTNPQSLNLYIYVQNNPLKFVDPDGTHLECTTVTITSTDTDGNFQSIPHTSCKWIDDGDSSGVGIDV